MIRRILVLCLFGCLLRKTGCGGTETAGEAEDQDAADHFVPG